MSKLYPCPYSIATRCNLEDPCMGCETWARSLANEEVPRFQINDEDIEDINNPGPTGHGDICYSDADPGL